MLGPKVSGFRWQACWEHSVGHSTAKWTTMETRGDTGVSTKIVWVCSFVSPCVSTLLLCIKHLLRYTSKEKGATLLVRCRVTTGCEKIFGVHPTCLWNSTEGMNHVHPLIWCFDAADAERCPTRCSRISLSYSIVLRSGDRHGRSTWITSSSSSTDHPGTPLTCTAASVSTLMYSACTN